MYSQEELWDNYTHFIKRYASWISKHSARSFWANRSNFPRQAQDSLPTFLFCLCFTFQTYQNRVVPVAESCGVFIGIHPDDPPFYPLGGVPRCVRPPWFPVDVFLAFVPSLSWQKRPLFQIEKEILTKKGALCVCLCLCVCVAGRCLGRLLATRKRWRLPTRLILAPASASAAGSRVGRNRYILIQKSTHSPFIMVIVDQFLNWSQPP